MQQRIITLLCIAGMAISAHTQAASLKIRPNAPQRYVVKNGDTLWGISGKYLYSPWQWNRLWGANRNAIRNPHLIYPGQVLVYATSTASRDWVLNMPKPVQTAFP